MIRLSDAAGWIGASTLLGAGALKLADLPSFAQALSTWTLYPDVLLSGAAVVVPATEVGVGGAWVMGLARGRTAMLGALLVACLTVAYAAQAAVVEVPNCGCFGRLTLIRREFGAWQFVVGRNVVLAGILAYTWLAGQGHYASDSR